jgi:FkbM family methyltransferase
VIPLSGLCKKVVAIEANPTTFGLLEINLRINDVRNCRALNVAASDRKETLQFIINRTNSGGSKRMPVIRDYRYFYDNPETIQVPAVPLDDLFRDEAIDLIVMDIEGSEYFALKGMQTILSRANVLQ